MNICKASDDWCRYKTKCRVVTAVCLSNLECYPFKTAMLIDLNYSCDLCENKFKCFTT